MEEREIVRLKPGDRERQADTGRKRYRDSKRAMKRDGQADWKTRERHTPSAMMAASLNFQSRFEICSWTKGITRTKMASSQQLPMRERHTPAALHGFHSSSSSLSSYITHTTAAQ